MTNSTTRFSNRVENYIKYRPGYPAEVFEVMTNKCGLNASSVVADIGSGMGIFTKVLLAKVKQVFAVEPNDAMREATEKLLQNESEFVSVNGTSENTTLPDSSVDFITAAQAFHWFHVQECKMEFRRIGKPDAWTVIIWNERREDSSPFLRGYEALLQKYGTDYAQVNHTRFDAAAIAIFFAPQPFECHKFDNCQLFDYAGLERRLLSSSYTPDASAPHYEEMLRALKELFDTTQNNGIVSFDYDTTLYYGQL
ncbi:MAG: class I SAM-dependent methyltransferase [Abditibacteriaceae bacterium]